MPIDVLAGFVDRRDELALFHQMLRGETDKRVLLIFDQAEHGKTCFLRKLLHECESRAQPAPVVLLDFDQRRSGLTGYAGVAHEIRRSLGDASTPAICAYEDAGRRRAGGPDDKTSRAALLSILVQQYNEEELHTLCFLLGEDYESLPGKGKQAKARDLIERCERRGRTDELWAHVSSRQPSVSGSRGTLAAGTHGSVADIPSADEVGRALLSDLAGLAVRHRRVVLLIDTFEQAGEEMCAWLERWLFEPLRLELAHALVVVAGRPECRDLFAGSPLWGHLGTTIDRFAPLSQEDILAHYALRGLSVSGAQTELLQIARLSPGKMRLIGDWLQQAQGGRR